MKKVSITPTEYFENTNLDESMVYLYEVDEERSTVTIILELVDFYMNDSYVRHENYGEMKIHKLFFSDVVEHERKEIANKFITNSRIDYEQGHGGHVIYFVSIGACGEKMKFSAHISSYAEVSFCFSGFEFCLATLRYDVDKSGRPSNYRDVDTGVEVNWWNPFRST